MWIAKLALALAIPYFGFNYLAGPRVVCHTNGTEIRVAADLRQLADSLDEFADQVGRYPRDWAELMEAGLEHDADVSVVGQR